MSDERSPQRVWLVRHGETEWSASGRHTGRTDLPLTQQGERQATMLARRLARQPFALVLTSPLQRAVDTCRLAGLLADSRRDPDLMEWDYGSFEGRTADDIRREHPGWTIWAGPVPGGETLEQVSARVDRVIARAVDVPGDVALFAHGHVLRVLAARWLGLTPDAGRCFALDTASVSVLGAEHERRVIRTWNESYKLVEFE